jgi:hypothetical protein
MWYKDPDAVAALNELGLFSSSDDESSWSDVQGMRSVTDFEGGISMTTRVVADDPRFDVSTITEGDPRDWRLLIQAFKEHSAEIRRRTAELQEKGSAALVGRGRS